LSESVEPFLMFSGEGILFADLSIVSSLVSCGGGNGLVLLVLLGRGGCEYSEAMPAITTKTVSKILRSVLVLEEDKYRFCFMFIRLYCPFLVTIFFRGRRICRR